MPHRSALILEFADAADPISGWLSFGGEPKVSFSGYLGLLAAIEAARDVLVEGAGAMSAAEAACVDRNGRKQ